MKVEEHAGTDRPRGESGRGDNPRSTRLLQRAARKAAFRRYLKLTLLSALLPGSGFVAGGRRRLGTVVLTLSALSLVALLVVVAVIGPRRLGLGIAVRPLALTVVGIVALVAAGLWVLLLVASQRVLEPRWLSLGQRLLGTGLVVALCSVVAAPLALGSQYAFVQRDLVTTIFDDTPLAADPGTSLTRPKNVTVSDPWAGQSRVNVLLVGSDAGKDRVGTRTDTVIVASVDTRTGKTVLFSLPRNLQRVPFPKGPFRDAYPNGFTNRANPSEYLLNAIYGTVPAEHPELFPPRIKDKGIEALKLAVGATLGLPIDYYVMVDLAGFQKVIDALGGVRVNVRYRIPIGTKQIGPGVCTQPTGWIEPGENKLLDGRDALWFARARCGGGELADADNSRIRRQRCVIGAIIDRATPATLLRRYQALAGAAKQIVQTDIPQGLLPAFLDLGDKVQQQPVESLPFTAAALGYRNYDPNYPRIRQLVRKALEPPAATPTSRSGASPSRSAEPSTTPSPVDESKGKPQSLDAVC